MEHFSQLGYPVPQGANAADHFISVLTETGTPEEGKSKLESILDTWETDGLLSDSLTEGSDSKSGIIAPTSPGNINNDDVISGFALGFFEELWWLMRR